MTPLGKNQLRLLRIIIADWDDDSWLPSDLARMKLVALRKLARECGIEVASHSRQPYIEALMANKDAWREGTPWSHSDHGNEVISEVGRWDPEGEIAPRTAFRTAERLEELGLVTIRRGGVPLHFDVIPTDAGRAAA